MRIYLVGFMGAGKTTAGRVLARRLDWHFVDLDREIERRAGMDIPTLFERHGEEGFRQREHEALQATSSWPRVVIATGGGAFAREANIEVIEQAGVSVWIDPPLELLFERLGRSAKVRPLFQDRARARKLFEDRLPSYARARLRVEVTTEDNSESVAERIIQWLKETPCAI